MGITVAMGITMLVNAGPTVTSDATRSQFAQTSDVVTPLSLIDKACATIWDSLGYRVAPLPSLMDGIRQHQSGHPIEGLWASMRDEASAGDYAERWAP